MLRTAIFFVFVAGMAAQIGRDYTDELMKLTTLTDQKKYQEAISGYRKLQSEAGTPEWLKAASEYEIAEIYGTLREPSNAVAALERAVQLGFDDCLTPRSSERLTAVLPEPGAAQAIAKMQITEADFRELFWLKSEVQHADHDARMMITANINRVDQQPTEIPQAQIPIRPTNSPGVLYWREQLRLIQRLQREFVQKSDIERMSHVTKMAIAGARTSASAALESARLAHAAAESRRMELRQRALVAGPPSSDRPKACVEWK
jgi:hypothetical protein